MSTGPIVILGIDPGSHVTGYGVIVSDKGKVRLLALGTINTHKLEGHYEKLSGILHRVDHLIRQFKPTCLAIEAPFMPRMFSPC